MKDREKKLTDIVQRQIKQQQPTIQKEQILKPAKLPRYPLNH